MAAKRSFLLFIGFAFLLSTVIFTNNCFSSETKNSYPGSEQGAAKSRTLVYGTISVNEAELAENHETYEPFLSFLGEKMASHGIDRVEFLNASTPVEMAKLMRQGKVDIFEDAPFSCNIVSKLAGGNIVAFREKGGKQGYKSVFFVQRDSEIESVSDLAGKMIVLSHPASTYGYFLPKAHLINHGLLMVPKQGPGESINPGETGYYHSKSKEGVIEDVLSGKAQAGSYTENRIRKTLKKINKPMDSLKIVGHTVTMYRRVVLVRNNLDKGIQEAVLKELTDSHKTERGKQVLYEFDKTTAFKPFKDEPELVIEQIRNLAEYVEREIIHR